MRFVFFEKFVAKGGLRRVEHNADVIRLIILHQPSQNIVEEKWNLGRHPRWRIHPHHRRKKRPVHMCHRINQKQFLRRRHPLSIPAPARAPVAPASRRLFSFATPRSRPHRRRRNSLLHPRSFPRSRGLNSTNPNPDPRHRDPQILLSFYPPFLLSCFLAFLLSCFLAFSFSRSSPYFIPSLRSFSPPPPTISSSPPPISHSSHSNSPPSPLFLP